LNTVPSRQRLHDVVRRQPIGVEFLRVDVDHNGALIAAKRRGRGNPFQGREYRTNTVQRQVLYLRQRPRWTGKNEIPHRQGPGVETNDERSDGPRRHERARTIHVGNCLRERLAHVRTGMKTQPEQGARGITAFIVEKGTPGLGFGAPMHKMGLNGSPTGELILDDVCVPSRNLLGSEGEGFTIAMKALDSGRIGISAQAVGLARGALDLAVAHANERRQFGHPISRNQGIQFMLADMATAVDAARLMTWQAASACDRGVPFTHLASMAKLFATDTSMHVTTDAVQIFGGYGYITEFPIERYMRDLLPPRDPVLAEIESYALENDIPIVGPAVARFLASLVMLTKAKRIFELGSAIGYSTIWLARAAGPEAEVHYSDGDPEKAGRARRYLERAGVADQIQIHIGDALAALSSTPGVFDVIFNDVDKDGYPAVLDAVPDRIRPGGLFITDNTLWHGRVLNPKEATDRAVSLFNRRLFDSPDFYTTQLPIRDGVSVAIRL